MRELIERGHIYIAQPPLYKVKRGKQEHYVKDDAELNSYLLDVALEKAKLHVNADAPPITGTALASLAQSYVGVMTIMDRLANRYDRRLLEQMIYLPAVPADAIDDATRLVEWSAQLEEALAHSANGDGRTYQISVKETDEGVVSLEIQRGQHGVEQLTELSIRFFDSPEYRQFTELGAELHGLIENGAYICRGERQHEVGSFKEAMEWLLGESRKGQSIQRYKGLGEMNPEQLWDTTINPQTRRLMQVRIEDAVAADEIFTTLMGDQVEPRREFIERNALTVANLDV
jgi:DNA gyrase subunit B